MGKQLEFSQTKDFTVYMHPKTNQKALVPSCNSMGRELSFLIERLPWYHPDCRHFAAFALYCGLRAQNFDHSFTVQILRGNRPPALLVCPGKLSSGSRSRRGSEEAKSNRTCTNHRLATGRQLILSSLNAGQRYICLLLTRIHCPRGIVNALTWISGRIDDNSRGLQADLLLRLL